MELLSERIFASCGVYAYACVEAEPLSAARCSMLSMTSSRLVKGRDGGLEGGGE